MAIVTAPVRPRTVGHGLRRLWMSVGVGRIYVTVGWNARAVVADCAFLSVVVFLSFLPYLGDLGFYSDDWAFLASLHSADDQSLLGLARELRHDHVETRMRPTAVVEHTVLYWLFGLDPTGYHLVNAAVILMGCLLFYLVLTELGSPRLLAVSSTLVFSLLPHASTDRFWYAAAGYPTGMAFYLVSLLADLRAGRAERAHYWCWKVPAVLCFVGSAMATEVTIPLYALNIMLVVVRGRRLTAVRRLSRSRSLTLAALTGPNILALIAVVAFKIETTTRTGIPTDYFSHVTRTVVGAVVVSYGSYGVALPHTAAWSLQRASGTALVVGALLALLIMIYLLHLALRLEAREIERRSWLAALSAGVLLFALGYAIFLTNDEATFTSTGLGNRINIAAAMGVALSYTGAIGWISRYLGRWHMAFCILVTSLSVVMFTITAVIGGFWADAYRQERALISEVRQAFPVLPPGSTVILDGICPYAGPAVVFESSWDLAGVLNLLHDQDWTISADVVTRHTWMEETGLSTSVYGFRTLYPFGDQFFLYDARHDVVHVLASVAAAQHYFGSDSPGAVLGCPEGDAGVGVPLFPLDRAYYE